MSDNRLDDYKFVASYPITDPDGEVIVDHQRFERIDPKTGARSKTFSYYDPFERRRWKPPGADKFLYRLVDVRRAIREGRTIHWPEGEKDCDSLWLAGVAATSTHQGAGHVTIEQAAWLREASAIVIWVDKDRDNWAVGAYDACLRFNLLMELDYDPRRVRFVKARGVRNKDATDHLKAGYTVEQALSVDPDRLAATAREYTPGAGRRAGYRYE